MVAAQNPEATMVAGFRAWLALGYAVRRGERALRIWVPVAPSRRRLAEWGAKGAVAGERPRTWFKLGPVFAQQVEPLPAGEPTPLQPPSQRSRAIRTPT